MSAASLRLFGVCILHFDQPLSVIVLLFYKMLVVSDQVLFLLLHLKFLATVE